MIEEKMVAEQTILRNYQRIDLADTETKQTAKDRIEILSKRAQKWSAIIRNDGKSKVARY